MWNTLVRPSQTDAQQYRAKGWWRSQTFLDDLEVARSRRPDTPAVISYQDGRLHKTLSYQDLHDTVERFAAALRELGVQRRDVVVIYLPNWWMLTPLYLACARIGAVSAPVVPSLGARELGQVLAGSRAKVCIIPQRYGDTDYVARLDGVAPDSLAHRVVVRTEPTDLPDGYSDFQALFADTPWERTHPVEGVAPPAADDICLLLYTSGTTGEPKAVAHSYNTLYAATRAISDPYRLDENAIVTIPHYLTHMAGLTYSVYMSLVLGGVCVMQDNSDMGLMLDMIETHRVTFGYAAPMYVMGLLSAQRERARDVSTLRHLISGSAPIPPQLIAEVLDVLGVELGALWGMTENGAVTITRPEDPRGWAANSDGRVVDWMQLRIAADEGDEIGRLLVRGAAQCLGYLNQRDIYLKTLDADGWFDTGDMCRPDGRGGIRITGRRVDLITRRWANKVPTLEVEAVILRHPGVREVVLIGYPDVEVPGAECVCAVIVPNGTAPTVEELNKFLDGEGMTWENWPDRIQLVNELPKNSLGKVLRPILRQGVESDGAGSA
jgi:cyclohexanecarboxylate-CoA ligase